MQTAICGKCKAKVELGSFDLPEPWRWEDTPLGKYLVHCDDDPDYLAQMALTEFDTADFYTAVDEASAVEDDLIVSRKGTDEIMIFSSGSSFRLLFEDLQNGIEIYQNVIFSHIVTNKAPFYDKPQAQFTVNDDSVNFIRIPVEGLQAVYNEASGRVALVY